MPVFEPQAHAAAALNRQQHHRLASPAAPRNLSLAVFLVHVLGLAADERLVNFDRAGKLRGVGVRDGRAYAVAEISRGLIGDVERALELESGHTLFGFAHQIDGEEPLGKREVRVVEYRTDLDGELIAAGIAGEQPARVDAGDFV